jgi:putative spermidine/putrescine transport system substrate-binding protein
MSNSFNRRKFLNAVLASSTIPIISNASKSYASPTNIVATAFAGNWEKGLRDGVVSCYESKNGGKVSFVSGSPSDFTQKIMATRGKPVIDVAIGTDIDVFVNSKLGIIDKLIPSKIPNLSKLLPIFTEPFEGLAFGFDGGRDGIAVNTNKIKNPPKGWLEFTEQVAKGTYGRAVMFPHPTNTDGLAVLWLLNRELGGSINNPDPVMKRIRQMKPYITKFFTSNAEPGTALISGEIDIAQWTDGRTNGVQASHENIKFFSLLPGSPFVNICMMKVRNGSESAWEYLNCAADAKNQAAWNKYFPGYYVTSKDIIYPPESKLLQDPSSLDQSFKNWIQVPWKEMANVRANWLEAWNKEIGA